MSDSVKARLRAWQAIVDVASRARGEGEAELGSPTDGGTYENYTFSPTRDQLSRIEELREEARSLLEAQRRPARRDVPRAVRATALILAHPAILANAAR